MPPVIGAVAAVIAGIGGEIGIDVSVATATAIADVVVASGVSMIISGVVGLISGALSPAKRPSSMIVSATDANAAWRVVYGFTRISGVPTFVNSSGPNNGWLYMILTICKGPIESIDTMYFNGAAIPLDSNGNGLGEWNGYVHAEFDTGNPANTSQPFPSLEAALPGYWTSACLQRGHAKAYVRLLWNENLFSGGIPNITFDVHGRQVYDPRSSTTGWSANPALCIRDFLTDPNIGLMANPATEINDASFIAAANVCDETVALKGTVSSIVPGDNTGDKGSGYVAGDLVGIAGGNGDCAGWVANVNSAGAVNSINVSDPGSGYSTANAVATTGGTGKGLVVNITATSGTEPMYTANGAFETTQTPGAILNDLALAMSGYVSYVQGQFMAFAGAWQTPTVTLGDEDMRGPLEVQSRYSRRDIFNAVQGTYLSEANDWQPSDYPAVIDGTWVDEDGATLWKKIDLPFTTSASMAQRIAKIQLERSRRQVTLTAHCKLTAGMVQPADVIMLNHARFGWNAKTFLVTDVSFVSAESADNPALGVDLILNETDANIYSWTAADELAAVVPALGVTPDAGVAQPPTNVTATSGAAEAAVGADGIIINRILVQWTAPADQFVVAGGKIVIQHRLSAGPGPWLPAQYCDGASTQAFIAPVSGNTNYDIAVWSINAAGAPSSVAEVLGVNTNVLISSFTGQSGTVATLSNFTQDNLKSGVLYQQSVLGMNSENMIQNSIFQYDSVGAVPAGWTGSGVVAQDTLPNGATGNVLKLTSANYAPDAYSNAFQLVPGETYLFGYWIKTGGVGYWEAYRGNYGDAGVSSPGAPTAWSYETQQFTMAASSKELIGQFLLTNTSATSDWAEIWGVSCRKVRSLANEVNEGGGNYFAGEHGADITGNHTSADTSKVNGVASSSISPIAGLMPNEAGADITANHTAADTSKVNGVASSSISPIAVLMPNEAGADSTLNHAIQQKVGGPGSNVALTGGALTKVGLTFNVTSNGTTDTFSIFMSVGFVGSVGYYIECSVVVDGATGTLYGYGQDVCLNSTYQQSVIGFANLSGLAAGTHTLDVYVSSSNGGTFTIGVGGSYATLSQVSKS